MTNLAQWGRVGENHEGFKNVLTYGKIAGTALCSNLLYTKHTPKWFLPIPPLTIAKMGDQGEPLEGWGQPCILGNLLSSCKLSQEWFKHRHDSCLAFIVEKLTKTPLK